jgi:hypothetical protein
MPVVVVVVVVVVGGGGGGGNTYVEYAPVHAPVADPGLIKNRWSYSTA